MKYDELEKRINKITDKQKTIKKELIEINKVHEKEMSEIKRNIYRR